MSDSLALARREPESLRVEQTWSALVHRGLECAQWLQCSWGGATTSDLLAQSDYWLHSSHTVDCMIVQAGIVDCAPRAFTRREAVFQQALAAFTRFFPRAGRQLFEALRRRRQVSYVDASRFRQNVRAFRDIAKHQGARLIWIPVMGAGFYDDILPGVLKKIVQTNQILLEELGGGLLDVRLGDEYFMNDGHHLTPGGHRILADKILARLNKEQG